MKLLPPDPSIENPDAELQAKHNSMAHPEVRNDIGASTILPQVLAYVRAKAKAGARLLDVGVGNGELLRVLRAEWADEALFGTDIEPAHVKLALWRTGQEMPIEVADFSVACPFEGPFDFITAIGWVWCDWRNRHMYVTSRTAGPEPTYLDRVAVQVGRYLAPGGRFIFDWRRTAEQYDLKNFDAVLNVEGLELELFVDSSKDRNGSALYIYRKIEE